MQIVNYVAWAIAHLGALALMLLCAAGFGDLFLRRCRFQSLAERIVFSVGLGLGLCASVFFILGLLGVLFRSVIVILTVAGAAATVLNVFFRNRHSWGIRHWPQILSFRPRKDLFTLTNSVVVLLVVLAVCYWVLLLMKSQYPPHNWDSTSNHLVIARENLNGHRLTIVPGIPMPVLPLLNHMLFTWGLALKDDILPQMVVHTFFMLIALGLYSIGKRQNQSAVGCAAAALWLAHPLIRELASTAYVDIGLTCFVFLGLYALRVFWDHGETPWWYLGMALLAMASGTKLTGLFFLGLGSFVGFGMLAREWIRTRKQTLTRSEATLSVAHRFNSKSLTLGWALALLVVMPWCAFTTYITGNPFWPFFAQYSKGIWGSPWLVGSMGDFTSAALKSATLRRFLTLSADFVRFPERFNAENNLIPYPLIVIWPVAWLVALFNRSVRWWVFWALAFTVFWFLQAPFIRYWLPVLPFAGLALFESIEWILEKVRLPAILRNGVLVAAATVILSLSAYELGKQIRLGLPPSEPETREAFLRQINGYAGVNYVNAHADPSDTVCVLSASWLNYFFRLRVIDLRSALYSNRKPSFRWPNDQLWTQWLDYEHVKWIFIYYHAAELSIPKQNPLLEPFWPDYQLVYADHDVWVFQRKEVPSQVSRVWWGSPHRANNLRLRFRR